MSTQDPALLAPLATVLPDPSSGEALTSSQWATLLAIAETVIPAVCRTSQKPKAAQLSLSDTEYDAVVGDIKATLVNPPEDAILDDYLAEGATSYDIFRRELQRTLGTNVREDARKGLAFILDTLKYAS